MFILTKTSIGCWNSHIEYISNKISKSCGALAKIRHCVDIKTLVNVYHALINSYLRYGIIVWGGASSSALRPLQTALNKAIRIITFAPYGNLDLTPAYQQLKLLTVEKTYMLEMGKFTYKSKNQLLPTAIGNQFEISSANLNHNHFVRNRKRPVRLLCNTKTGEKSVQFKSSLLWDTLPNDIKTKTSFYIFKKAYKEYLVNSISSN